MKLKTKRKKKKKGTAKKKGRGRAIRLSIDTIEEMFALYCSDYTEAQICDTMDLSAMTVHKYIQFGAPSRGIEPLKLRRERILKSVLSIQDKKTAERLANKVSMDTIGYTQASRRLINAYRASERLDDDTLPPIERLKYERVAREPDINDLKAWHSVIKDDFMIGQALFDPIEQQQSGVNINVSQQQGQLQGQEVMSSMDEADMEAVFKHIENLSGASSADRTKMSRRVESISIQQENQKKAHAISPPDDEDVVQKLTPKLLPSDDS